MITTISLVVSCFLLHLLCYVKKGEMACPDSDEDTVASWSLDGSEKDIILRGMASYKYEDGVPALYLDGNTSYADVPSISLFQFPAFSITCWVKVLEPAKTPGYIYADWSSPYQFSVWIHGNWKVVYFQLRNNFGKNMISMYTAISFNVWEHVTLTWDEGLKLAKIYINGTLEGRKIAEGGLKSYELKNNSHSFYQIGRKEDSGQTFHGLVRKLKVFNKVLTTGGIKDEMKEFSSGCAMDSIGVSNPDVIPDSHMIASSKFAASRYQPEYGRLGDIRGDGWCSLTNNSNDEWLQVYFGDMFTVCRVDTQGDVNGNEWVTAFKLSFSKDGVSWTTYKHNNGTEVEFRRQGNSIIVDKHFLSVPVQARYIRFNPTDRHNFNCLRVEVYGSKIYHFDTWLIIANERLTLDLLSSTSQQYNTMKTNVMQECV